MTRLDRMEPELNRVAPGEQHDTTTPAAMVGILRMLLMTPVLTPDSRERLTGWMIGCQTGGQALRAGVPHGWTVGDKTGRATHGATNDIAVLWPADRRPILVAAYTIAPDKASDEARSAVLAEVGRIVADAFRGAEA